MGKMTEEKKKRRKKRLLKKEFEITDEDLRSFTEFEEYLETVKEADPEFKKSSDTLKTLLAQYPEPEDAPEEVQEEVRKAMFYTSEKMMSLFLENDLTDQRRIFKSNQIMTYNSNESLMLK